MLIALSVFLKAFRQSQINLRIPIMNKKGFTLLEILVATLILALVTTGLAYVFLAGKRHILHTRSKIQAAELGRLFLAPLQMDVRQDTWNQAANALSATPPGGRDCASQPGCPAAPERTLDGITYDARYTINRDNPIPNVNKVKVDITWTEPAS